MYQTTEQTIREGINNASLVFCARIAEKVKQPPYIPFFEVCTYDLVARYFELTEKRINNAYKSHRYIFENDCAMLSGKEILQVAKNVKSLGTSYGHLCEFSNGVVAQIAYSVNMVFNIRALLHFAVTLKDESEVARAIFDMLESQRYKTCGFLNKKTQWFLMDVKEPEKLSASSCNRPIAVCPYLASLEGKRSSKDEDLPINMHKKSKSNHKNSKRCAMLDENGNVLRVFSSGAEAAKTLGLCVNSVYGCCIGRLKSTGSGKGHTGVFRFAYV